MDKITLAARISAALENELAALRIECGITSGDIAPAQALLWDITCAELANLFGDLIEQNKEV